MDRLIVRKDTYLDSVFLMSLSADLGHEEGIELGQVVLATPANRQLLAGQGFDQNQLAGLGATDLIIALRAKNAGVLDKAEARLQQLLERKTATARHEGPKPMGLDGALQALPGANLVVISVPGQYAAYEAHKALRSGMHVMVFSDNVSVEDEIALKREAVQRGLLLMGPDCGTAILQGVMLGFANKVRRGGIGVVGASGTGTQEVTCLIDRAGMGISQAIGTGGRDLSEKVGALTTLFAIDQLAKDENTKVIVVISKPPSAVVAAKVLERLQQAPKPSVVHFVGTARSDLQGKIHFAPDLEAAAWTAVKLCGGTVPSETGFNALTISHESEGLARNQRYLSGLFTGGTMAAEALAFLRSKKWVVRSNLDHGSPDKSTEQKHEVIDLGDDEFTCGRPHPMIEPAPRVERLIAQADNPLIGVVLLDVVLGTGSHADPAGAMVKAIEIAKQKARDRGGYLPVVASVTGTEGDYQNLAQQIQKLKDAGVVVVGSNIQAVRCAYSILEEAGHG